MAKRFPKLIKVVLTSNVEGLGNKGEIKTVKAGFCQYLLRYNLAELALPEKLKAFQKEKERAVAQKKREEKELKKVLSSLPEKVQLKKKANEKGVLFEEVKGEEIAKALGLQKWFKELETSKPLKKVGNYKVKLKLEGGKEVEIKLSIKPKA